MTQLCLTIYNFQVYTEATCSTKANLLLAWVIMTFSKKTQFRPICCSWNNTLSNQRRLSYWYPKKKWVDRAADMAGPPGAVRLDSRRRDFNADLHSFGILYSVQSFLRTFRDRTECPETSGRTECPETSVRNYQSTLSKIPRHRTSHIQRGGNVKYVNVYTVLFRRGAND